MKALMICTEKLPVPPVRGGAIQTYIQAVAPALAKHHDVTILGVTDPDLPEHEEREGVTYVRVAGDRLSDYARHVSAFLRSHEFDLIHLFNRPRLVLPVREAAPEARIILSMHNDMFDPGKVQPAEAEQAVEQVERIVTVSNYVGERLASFYPQARPKLHTIYAGVDLNRFAPRWSTEARQVRAALRAEHGLGDDPLVLFVGRLSPKKGVDVLVDAMSHVIRKHQRAALALVGSKWFGTDQVSQYVSYVRTLTDAVPVRVIPTGYVPSGEVQRWFWTADLLVCPSLWREPLARVHYEAMAAGLPIITTERGGNPEVVAGLGNGIVVANYKEPAALAEAINAVLDDPGLAEQMGRRGRALAEERFGWQRVIADIRAVWEPQAQQ